MKFLFLYFTKTPSRQASTLLVQISHSYFYSLHEFSITFKDPKIIKYMNFLFKMTHYLERICRKNFYRNWSNWIRKVYVIYDLNKSRIDRGCRMQQTLVVYFLITHIPTLLPHFSSDSRCVEQTRPLPQFEIFSPIKRLILHCSFSFFGPSKTYMYVRNYFCQIRKSIV